MQENAIEGLQESCARLRALAQAKGFLAREFLGWLWFQAECRQEPFRFERGQSRGALTLDIWIDDRVHMQPTNKEGHEQLLRGGDPSHSAEAAASLANGMSLRELRLGVHIEGLGDFTALINAVDLNPKSLQIPLETATAPEELDTAELLLSRIEQVECFMDALDGLFATFLAARGSAGWQDETLVAMREWVGERRGSKRPIH